MSREPIGAPTGKPTARAPRPAWIGQTLVACGGILLVLGAGVGLVLFQIRAGLDSTRTYAMDHYAGDPSEALMQLVQDEQAPMRERNHAIWALGRLREARALPRLAELQTGATCDHDAALCQHELEKALRRIETDGR